MKWSLNNAKTKSFTIETYNIMTKMEELSTSLETPLNELNNTKPLYDRQQIENTPFWAIQNEQGYNLIMGKWKLNQEPFTTKEELKKWMNKNTWNIHLSMMICVAQDMKNIEKEIQPQNTTYLNTPDSIKPNIK